MSNNVYAKLMNIQSELKAPKGQKNSFGNYNYRSCEDILEAVKPLLLKEKVVLLINDEVKNLDGRYYVKATARFINTEDGQEVLAEAYARESESKKGMDEAQITGATSSYARKYALNGLFAIDDTKDADATNTVTKTQDTLSDAQVKRLYAIGNSSGKTPDQVKAWILAKWKKTSTSDLTKKEYDELCKVLERQKKDVSVVE